MCCKYSISSVFNGRIAADLIVAKHSDRIIHRDARYAGIETNPNRKVRGLYGNICLSAQRSMQFSYGV